MNKVYTIGGSETTKSSVVYKDVNMTADHTQLISNISRTKHLIENLGRSSDNSIQCVDDNRHIVVLTDSDDTGHRLQLYTSLTDIHKDVKDTLYTNDDRWYMNNSVNLKAVHQSVRNIFSWIPGERILNPEFGTSLRSYLYNGITDYTIEQVRSEIQQCMSKWEPRVKIEDVIYVSDVDDVEDNTVHLQIVYSVPGLSEDLYAYEYVGTQN